MHACYAVVLYSTRSPQAKEKPRDRVEYRTSGIEYRQQGLPDSANYIGIDYYSNCSLSPTAAVIVSHKVTMLAAWTFSVI